MSHAPATVLIVDDEIDMRVLVRVVLETSGHGMQVVAEANDGEEALTFFEELDPPPVPTVVILDNRMPGITGVEAAAQMRQHFPDQQIILFSAYLTPEVRAAAAEAGITTCVGKEDVARLPEIVLQLASGAAST